MIEVRQLSIQNLDKAPFSGVSICVILEQNEQWATIFHPFTMTVWEMTVADQLSKEGDVVVREGLKNSERTSEVLWVEGQELNRTIIKIDEVIQRKLEEAKLFSRVLDKATFDAVVKLDAVLNRKTVEQSAQELLKRLPHQEEAMTMKKAAAKKATATKKEKAAAQPKKPSLYLAKENLTVDYTRGQGTLVIKALKAFSTPKTLEEITEKVKSNGEYKLKDGIELKDSVRYHLNRFDADGMVSVTEQ